jgi:hypothetical protein
MQLWKYPQNCIHTMLRNFIAVSEVCYHLLILIPIVVFDSFSDYLCVTGNMRDVVDPELLLCHAFSHPIKLQSFHSPFSVDDASVHQRTALCLNGFPPALLRAAEFGFVI